eukprot:4386853-Pyramimonas_sp.AAC.1
MSSWAARFVADVESLSELEDGSSLLWGLHRRCSLLFADPDYADEFTRIDVRQLRSSALSAWVPPPGQSVLPEAALESEA